MAATREAREDPMADPTTEAEELADERELGATELLVEEVSIDGLCGVY